MTWAWWVRFHYNSFPAINLLKVSRSQTTILSLGLNLNQFENCKWSCLIINNCWFRLNKPPCCIWDSVSFNIGRRLQHSFYFFAQFKNFQKYFSFPNKIRNLMELLLSVEAHRRISMGTDHFLCSLINCNSMFNSFTPLSWNVRSSNVRSLINNLK